MHKHTHIIQMNNALKMALDQGATMKMIAEDWEFLQIQVLINTYSFVQFSLFVDCEFLCD